MRSVLRCIEFPPVFRSSTRKFPESGISSGRTVGSRRFVVNPEVVTNKLTATWPIRIIRYTEISPRIHREAMQDDARSALTILLNTLGLPLDAIDRNIRLVGQDPVVPSRYRVGMASATALAAQAVGIIEIWKQRGGRDQTVTVDLRRAAVPGLRTISHTRRGGRTLQVPWPASERQVFFPTKDGRLMYLMRHAVYYEHLTKLLGFLDCAPDSAAIARTVEQWDSA